MRVEGAGNTVARPVMPVGERLTNRVKELTSRVVQLRSRLMHNVDAIVGGSPISIGEEKAKPPLTVAGALGDLEDELGRLEDQITRLEE